MNDETNPADHPKPQDVPGGDEASFEVRPRTKADAVYESEDLQHLSDLEHVRERPSMYIGDTTARGLHHLVYEVVDNSHRRSDGRLCQAGQRHDQSPTVRSRSKTMAAAFRSAATRSSASKSAAMSRRSKA